MQDLIYPAGRFEAMPYDATLFHQWLTDIEFLPQDLERSLLNLDESQLSCPYRQGGWSIRQIIHHVADSHMNIYIRFKLVLTENKPVIKPFDHEAWALLPDNDRVPVNVSITLLYALHRRWVELIRLVKPDEWNKALIHPEYGKEMDLWYLLGYYAWHGRHHTAQINKFRERMGW